MQFMHTVNGDRSKTAKIIKGNINHNKINIDIHAMLLRLIFLLYDFCGFLIRRH